MGEEHYRKDQWARRYDPHVESVNRLVDALRGESGLPIPYVAPSYGGTEAEVLFLFQAPGPMTDDRHGGSGFLSSENDDPTAQLFAECLDVAALDSGRVITWNARPWIGAVPAAGQPDVTDWLRRLLRVAERVRVVVLLGRVAQQEWRRFAARFPGEADRYELLESLLPSGRGITSGGQHTKVEGVASLRGSMRAARELIERAS
jgi:hypothetical protein